MTDLDRTRPADCLSDRALDQLVAEELAPAPRAAADAHVATCAACAARLGEIRAARAAFPFEAPAFEALVPAPAPRRRWAWLFAPALAAAAALVLVARPPQAPPEDRAKGGDALGFFVLHDGVSREGASGELVHPGDRLQLVATTATPRFLAVLERDASGRAAVFFPRGAEAAPVAVGRRVALPTSVELDEALGVGTVYGVFCARAVPVAPLRDAVERLGDGARWPDGCHADVLTYEARPR
jgi:hypothetical protein